MFFISVALYMNDQTRGMQLAMKHLEIFIKDGKDQCFSAFKTLGSFMFVGQGILEVKDHTS